MGVERPGGPVRGVRQVFGAGGLDEDRAGAHRAHDGAGARALALGGDQQQPVVDAPPQPQLAVHDRLAEGRGEVDGQQQLARPGAQPVAPVLAGAEVRQRHPAPARLGVGELHLGAVQPQGGHRVRRVRGVAAGAARGDVADPPRRLEAAADGLPPARRLVVEQAARVQHHVAPQGRHLLDGRRRHRGTRRRQGRVAAGHTGIAADRVQPGRRADAQTAVGGVGDGVQRQPPQRQQRRWGEQPVLQRRQQVRPPRDHADAGGRRQGERLVEVVRGLIAKRRQRQHQSPPSSAAPCARCRSRRRRPLSTTSGVNGGLSSQTPPVACAMAAVMAGTVDSCGPSPTSLAPNGPPGSWLSTRIGMISGVS